MFYITHPKLLQEFSSQVFDNARDTHSIGAVCQPLKLYQNDDVTMGAIASQITSLTIVYSTVYSGADQSKHQSSASLAFVWGIHRGPMNSPHKWPVTRKMFPFDDVTMMKSKHAAANNPSNCCLTATENVCNC